MTKVNKSAKDGKFVSDEEAKENPDTTYSTEVDNRTTTNSPVADEPDVETEVLLPEDRDTSEEDKINADMQQRTTTYDQETVTLARELGINPDNFDTEEALEKAVEVRREEVAAEKQAEEDRELKLENERSKDEEAE